MTPIAQYGLRRFGDLLVPGDAELPSFSASGCMAHLPAILAEMHASDRSDLQVGAGLLGLMPQVARAAVLTVSEHSDFLPDFVASPIRTALFNFRALIFSLYYAHPPILAAIGYEVAVHTEDLP